MRALVCGLLVWMVASQASAHGRFAATYQIIQHPADADVLAFNTTFGIVFTQDGGVTYHWVCRTALNIAATEDPPAFLTPEGTFLAATFRGLQRGPTSGCDWNYPVPELERIVIIDGIFAPDDEGRFYALTSSGGVTNFVTVTDDDGVSWTPTSAPIEPILFESILIAPSNPDRIYLSGVYPATGDTERETFVHRSDDDGATWERFPFERSEEGFSLELLAVDPADEDRLWVREVHDRFRDDFFDRVLRSDDGGETWTPILTVHTVTGMVFGPDGTYYLSARNPGLPVRDFGLWRKRPGGELEHVNTTLSLACLARRDGELWGCASTFAAGFAIGRSADDGVTFERVFDYDEMDGPVECDASSSVPGTCEVSNADIDRDLMLSDAGPEAGPDAGAGSGGGAGCGCTAPGPSTSAWPLGIVGLLWMRRGRALAHRRQTVRR